MSSIKKSSSSRSNSNRTRSSSSRRRVAASVAASVAAKQVEVCSICLESLKGRKKTYETECRHNFHQKCLEGTCKSHKVCPLCRKNIEVDCRIIKCKAGEMPGHIIQRLLQDATPSSVERMRAALLDMKFPQQTKFDTIFTFAQAFTAQK
jgi:hypothetical protein